VRCYRLASAEAFCERFKSTSVRAAAERDLNDAATWFREHSIDPRVPARFLLEVRAVFETIVEAPHTYVTVHRDIRRCRVFAFPGVLRLFSHRRPRGNRSRRVARQAAAGDVEAATLGRKASALAKIDPALFVRRGPPGRRRSRRAVQAARWGERRFVTRAHSRRAKDDATLLSEATNARRVTRISLLLHSCCNYDT
jgi:hypothetical protein